MQTKTGLNANQSARRIQDLNRCLTFLRFTLGIVLASHIVVSETQASPAMKSCSAAFNEPTAIERLNALMSVADRFAPLTEIPKGPRVRILMGAIEVGKVTGLTTTDGKPLNLAVGGIGTVMNDTWSAKAPRLAERGIETIAVTPLMRNIPKDKLRSIGQVKAQVDERVWEIEVLEYKMPNGGRILFLENENFSRRFDAIPLAGKNIYEMRDLPEGREGELEKQRIWSALSQATAKVYSLIGADAYIPQDGHLAPASYYIHRAGEEALTLAPVLHNERYLDSFYTPYDQRDTAARIWNVSHSDLNEFFSHGDHVVMTAAAIRTAERTGTFTAKSVANNTARILNREGLPTEAFPQIELFSRLAPEENFLAASNRPDVNVGLATASRDELLADGITHPEVVQQYSTAHGYLFGGPLEKAGLDIVTGKARAKRAVQKIFGLDLDPKKPLFVSFARLVEQKGLDFLVPNIVRILESGGQIVVGGPVGDQSGAQAQAAFRALKEKLDRERPDISHNYVLIEGNVMGRKKALLLAGHDFFPVPSRFEPCGLTDVEALFNGGQPIAPRIGGLTKGRNTIKYPVKNANDQASDLGWGIEQALKIYFKHPALFLRRQVAASREDFSLERHLNQSLQNQRVEIYYRVVSELERQVSDGKLGAAQAQNYIRQNILEKQQKDRAYVIEAFSRIHPDRRTPLLNWVVKAE
jgi:glycosyltransferase involved in cell wall biosynthesis